MAQSLKRFRALKVLLVLMLALAGGFYFLRIHRYPHTVTQNGWHMDYAAPLMACPCCFSRISRLEYNDKPIPMPRFPTADDNRWLRSSIDTPIGNFRIANRLEDWRYFFGDGRMPDDNETPITKEDLLRGYYLTNREDVGGVMQWTRKKGTPDHWCIMYGNACFWFDPLRLDQIDWDEISSTDTD